MKKPKVITLTGYGINCEEETKFAFENAGATADIVHVNDLIDKKKKLENYQILAFPGGFSYGDDTGSGNAYANRIRNHLWNEIEQFAKEDKLAIGICNGFQIMVNLGLLPATESYGKREAALAHNDSARYLDRWVDLRFYGNSPWIKDLEMISVPIAHGEGKFYVEQRVMDTIKKNNQIACKYDKGDMYDYSMLEPNPNGSIEDIAGITDKTGRLLGMMPHPERAVHFTNLPNWPLLKEKYKREGKQIPKEGPGMKIFRNAVAYFE
ncbi:phosphoribosylformylglycinamidine synthase I [Candidatus Micrarchaeota archaeon]|nr:phosphoribosylformylglycinamidine synthase I [Candidatus Micrarchaeota archaeon]